MSEMAIGVAAGVVLVFALIGILSSVAFTVFAIRKVRTETKRRDTLRGAFEEAARRAKKPVKGPVAS